MKKLMTLTFALLFTAGMAFGQNSDVNIDQTGNGNDSEVVHQINSPDVDIQSTVDQDGNHNQSVALLGRESSQRYSNSTETNQTQRGDYNEAYINLDDRGNLDGSNGIEINQTQIGNSNFGRIEGHGGSNATQYQRGNQNFAKVQTLNTNGDISQTQVGNHNEARATGWFDAPTSQKQYGNHNVSKLLDVGFGEPGDDVGSRAMTTYQEGDYNKIILQANDHQGVLSATQIGYNNTAKVSWDSHDVDTDIYQNGNSNTANVTQGASY